MKTFVTALLKGGITRRSLLAAALPLATCAFVLAASGTDKNPVTRPFQVKATNTIVSEMITPVWDSDLDLLKVATFTLAAKGTCTHAGLFTNSGEGGIYLDVSTGVMSVLGSGTVIAANGDELYWDAYGIMDPTQTTHQLTVTFNKGTGRFADATGGFVETSPTPPAGGGEFTYYYESTGKLTY